MKYILIFVLTVISFSQTSFAGNQKISPTEEDSKMVFDTAHSFAICAGHFKALSWYFDKSGLKESALDFNNSHNGWNLAGSYLLYSTGVIKDWQKSIDYIQGLVDTNEQKYKSMLEMNHEESTTELKKAYETNCKPWIELQESLIIEVRQNLAKMPSKK